MGASSAGGGAGDRGLLVTFSGLDGAGKTTQIELLRSRLEREGRPTRYLWSRGGYTPGFEALKAFARRLLKRKLPPPGDNPDRTRALESGGVRRVWLLIALLDLILLYGVAVRWWRWRGEVVVCDRYLWDTLVDFRQNFPGDAVERSFLWRTLTRVAPRPDLAVLLVVPTDVSVRRAEEKDDPFPAPPPVVAWRREQYLELAEEKDWLVLDGRRDRADIASTIADGLLEPHCAE